jgi:NTP pyrophosphatase (non-canonical NTP hydrolase)
VDLENVDRERNMYGFNLTKEERDSLSKIKKYKVEDYIEDCKVTETMDFDNIKDRLNNNDLIRLMHSAVGISTEAGELLDAYKKHIFYGRQIDYVNIEEEIGDLLWYISATLDVLGLTYEEVMEKNIKKLKARYPDQFTEKDAIERDLEKEREILENGNS